MTICFVVDTFCVLIYLVRAFFCISLPPFVYLGSHFFRQTVRLTWSISRSVTRSFSQWPTPTTTAPRTSTKNRNITPTPPYINWINQEGFSRPFRPLKHLGNLISFTLYRYTVLQRKITANKNLIFSYEYWGMLVYTLKLTLFTPNSRNLFDIKMCDWLLFLLQCGGLGVYNHRRRALPHRLQCAESCLGRRSPDKYLQMARCGKICSCSPDGCFTEHWLGSFHRQKRLVFCLL